MDDGQRWAAIAGRRRALAGLLEGLEPAQWEAQSLCSAWRIRDVAAHVAMTPAPLGWGQVLWGVARARGNVWAFGRDVAIAQAQAGTGAIVRALRDDAENRHVPPLTNVANLHMDAIVHTLDITVPLALDADLPPADAAEALRRAWVMGWAFPARRRLRGVRLVATDADLELGDGSEVRGGLDALLLLATGRTAAALPLLAGPGVGLVTEAAGGGLRRPARGGRRGAAAP